MLKKIEIPDYGQLIEKIKTRSGIKKWQATRHQQLAIDCAKALGDTESIGVYMRLFKRYPEQKLHACRDWVLKKCKYQNKGRVFLKTFHKHFNQ